MQESEETEPQQQVNIAEQDAEGSTRPGTSHSGKSADPTANSASTRVSTASSPTSSRRNGQLQQQLHQKKAKRQSLQVTHYVKETTPEEDTFSQKFRSLEVIDPRLRTWHVLERERIRRLNLPLQQLSRHQVLQAHPFGPSNSPLSSRSPRDMQAGTKSARVLGRSPLTGDHHLTNSKKVGVYAQGEGMPDLAASVEWDSRQPASPRTLAMDHRKLKLDVPYADVNKWRSHVGSAQPAGSV